MPSNDFNLEGNLSARKKTIRAEINSGKYDRIILPPADSLTESVESYTAMKAAKGKGIKFYTWTEKWEAPKESQPFKKKIKNFVQRRIYKTLTNVLHMGRNPKSIFAQLAFHHEELVYHTIQRFHQMQ